MFYGDDFTCLGACVDQFLLNRAEDVVFSAYQNFDRLYFVAELFDAMVDSGRKELEDFIV